MLWQIVVVVVVVVVGVGVGVGVDVVVVVASASVLASSLAFLWRIRDVVVIVVFVVVAFASFGLREAQIFTRKRTKHFDDCDFRASGGLVEKMFNEIARNKLKKWLF